MAGETEDRVRRLRELRDGGAISDEDYRKMVLDLLDGDEGDAQEKVEGAAETGGTPSPEPVEASPTQPDHVEKAPAKPVSGLEEPAGRPPKPTATSPVTDVPETVQPAPAPKANKTRIIVAAVVIAVVALVLLALAGGGMASKPSDVSQEYWNAGRKARSIGQDYLDGKTTADDATLDLYGCSISYDPEDVVDDPDMDSLEKLNDERIAQRIDKLTYAIEQKARVDETGAASSDAGVKDALKELDKALQGEI